MTSVARGLGKVILFGEHAVVYGVPALVVALDRGAEAQLSEGPPEVLVPGLGLRFSLADGEPLSRGLDQAIRAILGESPLEKTLTISLKIPPSRGLGSSASICVAIARLFYADQAEVIEAASRGEKVFHGNPSGIDVAASVRGGGLLFTRSQPPQIESIKARQRFDLIIADSGERGVTSEIVARIRARREADPKRTEEIFSSIGQVVQAAKQALASGDVPSLGALFNENHRLLFELGLSTERLEQGVAAALSAGAYGAKLTGAGAGGCLISLANAGAGEGIDAPSLSLASLVEAQLDPTFFSS